MLIERTAPEPKRKLQFGLPLVFTIFVLTLVAYTYLESPRAQAADVGVVEVSSYNVLLPGKCYQKNAICETCLKNGKLLTFHEGDLKMKEYLPNECAKPGAPVSIAKKSP